MKFLLAESHRYWWPAALRMPDPDVAGKLLEEPFELLFESQSREDEIALQDEVAAMTNKKERELREWDQLRTIIKGWKVSVGDAPVPFSPENLEKALKNHWFRVAAYRSYAESFSGQEARLKN